jgi:Family of unknown function (DUF6266)
MAILTQGILGPVIGKTGPVVGYLRFGQNITRSMSDSRKNRIETPKRKAQRQKIKLCNEFTKAFTGTGFFNRSFPAHDHTGSGYNRVTGAIMNRAIISNPEIMLSYPRILISQGPIPCVDYASALVNEEGDIVFTWTDNAGTGTAKENDKAILVAFFPGTRQAVYKFSDATRKDGAAVLEMDSIKGAAETWIGFLSADETNAADSMYSGSLTVL